jgi:hypothetical protein
MPEPRVLAGLGWIPYSGDTTDDALTSIYPAVVDGR